ncbi:phage tail protein [Methylobacterium oxalidis]|uniref:phage tail protein n=1 Tax=Methylobacterium oxalidis TaxID=944322 RepID=UPI003316122D
MTWQTFAPPVAPSPGTTNTPEIRWNEAEFGDSYTQASPDGINPVRDVLALTWETLTPAQAKTITDFLRARALAAEPFLYTPSDESTARKWTCRDWSDKRGEGGFRTVTATFRQSFVLTS